MTIKYVLGKQWQIIESILPQEPPGITKRLARRAEQEEDQIC